MKKAILFLAILSASFLSAQVVDQGKILVDLGIGLGIQHYQFTEKATNIAQPRDTSAAIEIPIGLEYGIKKWLGAGLVFNYASYLSNDSIKPTVRGFDIIPTVYLHIPWALNKLDLMGHIGYGYSKFSYDANNSVNSVYRAGGTVLNFGLKFRWLFSDDGHFGMQFWYNHSSYVYPNGEATDNSNTIQKFRLDGPSNNFGTGFFLRF
jgi:hypothetical protein